MFLPNMARLGHYLPSSCNLLRALNGMNKRVPHALEVQKREKADNSTQPQNGGADLTAYYESLEDSIRFATDNIPSR